jgi:hypothetical protein
LLTHGDKTVGLALEADRGTEPIQLDLSRATIGRKFSAYMAGVRSRRHDELGYPRLRVSFISTTLARINNMISEPESQTDCRASLRGRALRRRPLELRHARGHDIASCRDEVGGIANAHC